MRFFERCVVLHVCGACPYIFIRVRALLELPPPSLLFPSPDSSRYLLNTEFKGSVCLWCYLSASLSAGLFATSVTSMSGKQLQAVAAPTATVLASSVAALYFGFGSFGQSTAEEEFVLPYKVGWVGPHDTQLACSTPAASPSALF